MIIGKVLSQRALITPNREAMISRGRRFTFSQLNERSNQMANALLGLGVNPGDRVGILMANNNEFVETYFAAAKIGAVLVPLNIRLAPPELDFILEDCSVSTFIFGHGFDGKVKDMEYLRNVQHRISTGPCSLLDTLDYEQLLALAPSVEPSAPASEDDLQVIMYTSGTTGQPKGAMLTHGNMYVGAVDILIGLHYEYPDRCLLLAPFFHSGAITPLVGHIIRGISTVTMESFDPKGALMLIEKYRIQLMLGVTTIMQMILQEPNLERYDLRSWEMAFLPGSPLPYSLIKEAHDRLGILCQNLWGLTEMCGPGAVMNIEDILRKPESAGKAYFNVDIRIVDQEGQDVPLGQMGEIVVRGPNMMLGYWNQAEATQDTIKDGWLHTGDMGRFDEEGYLYVVDRIKDMILSGGENIYPAEIERIIREVPGVNDVAVVGIPHNKWGEVGKAFIEKRPGVALSAEEIIHYCRSKLAGYKAPKIVEFITALPRTPSGKVLKKTLRAGKNSNSNL